MGYGLHITRARHENDDEPEPITFEEWSAYVAGDPELEITGVAEITNPTTGEVICIEGEGMTLWRMEHGRRCWLHHHHGRISVNSPDDEVIDKMRAIATRLAARVQGDEGESYD